MSDIVRDIEVTPGLDELLQEAPQLATVPVRVDGAVLTQELPSRYVWTTTYAGVVTTFEKIADATEKRKVIRLVSLDAAMWVKSGGQSGAVWPANVPCVLTHTQEILVRADTGTTRIGVIAEFWAD